MALSTFHGLKLYRFDMGVGWLVILMCTTGFLNEILGELPKIGRKPSRPRRDWRRGRWIDKGRCETENGEKGKRTWDFFFTGFLFLENKRTWCVFYSLSFDKSKFDSRSKWKLFLGIRDKELGCSRSTINNIKIWRCEFYVKF